MALKNTPAPTFKLSLTFSEMEILQTALSQIPSEKLNTIKSKIAFAEFE